MAEASTSTEMTASKLQSPMSEHQSDSIHEAGEVPMVVEHYCFLAKYASSSMEVRLAINDTVTELKAILFSMTDIPPERQKILGLVKGKLASDDTLLGELQFPPTSLRGSPNPTTGEKRITITLIGTPLDQTFRDPGDKGAGSDLADGGTSDIDYNSPADLEDVQMEPAKDPKCLSLLRKAVSRFSFTFPVINEPRDGLKGGLLVLDLDYTIADTERLLSPAYLPRESMRPGLHEFLAAVYPYYDIAVWSQTSHWWLEAKLTELGCLTDERYRISFVLDRAPMFSITNFSRSKKKEKRKKHEVKALDIIWKRFPDHYGPHNTVHIDDLSRNFAMNPNCGLKISAYRARNGADQELELLQDYLIRLAHYGLKTFEQLGGHSAWKRLLTEQKGKEQRDRWESTLPSSTKDPGE